MRTEERIQKQKELVEELGRYHDQEGMQPIAGRILGLLMVMDQEEFTFEEIVEELQISKASVSNTLRLLETKGIVEYVTYTGDRKRYYRLKKHDDLGLIDDFKNKMGRFKCLLHRIMELKVDNNSPNSQYYQSIIKMIDFFFENFDKLEAEFYKKQ